MSGFDLWILVAVMTVVSFLPRALFMVFAPRLVLPGLLQRALRFVPAAVFPALIAPAAIMTPNGIDLSPDNARLIAVVVAAVVALRNANVFLVVTVGMLVLHLTHAAAGIR